MDSKEIEELKKKATYNQKVAYQTGVRNAELFCKLQDLIFLIEDRKLTTQLSPAYESAKKTLSKRQ